MTTYSLFLDSSTTASTTEVVGPANAITSELAALQADVQADAAAAAASAAAAEGFASDTADLLNNSASTIESRVIGPVDPLASGTAIGNTNVYYWPTSLKTYDQWLTEIETGMGTAGALKIVVAEVEGDGSLTLVSQITQAVETGRTTTAVDVAVPAGCVVGLQKVSGTWYYTAGTIPNGESEWYTAAVPTTSTAKTSSTLNGPHWQGTLIGEAIYKARSAYETAELIGDTETVGWPTIVATGSNTPANYGIVIQDAADTDGYLTKLTIGANAATTVTIGVASMSGTTATVVRSTTATLAAGVNEINLSLAIAAGQYPFVQGANYKFQNSSNPEGVAVWIKTTTALTTGDVLSSSTAHRFEVAFEIKSGMTADIGLLQGVGTGDGTSELSDTDNSGADVTTAFASAKASHAYPYVRPGAFTVTSLTAKGGGLYGPGVITENGDRRFLPIAPSARNLWEALRAELMEHIAAGDVISLIGDSISHFAFAGTGSAHWFNQFTRFANLGVAADEPIMTALRSSSTYTPAFYGVTFTGTVTTGTTGPISESAVLAAGAVLSFTGAYESIGFFYEQLSGAGTVDVKRAGVSLTTVNAAGSTDHDKFSGVIATGNAASATYTLEVSGGPVELTGLLRLGALASGPHKRLRTARFAHGSYTFPSFGTAAIAACVKQATYAGGVIVPIIALGINDSFSTAPTTVVTNATTLITALQAAGAPRIFAIPPMRPTSAWDASYTGGRTFEALSGPLRRLYRQQGVHVLPIDHVDWNGEAMFSDGLHPNAAGNARIAQLAIEHMAWPRKG